MPFNLHEDYRLFLALQGLVFLLALANGNGFSRSLSLSIVYLGIECLRFYRYPVPICRITELKRPEPLTQTKDPESRPQRFGYTNTISQRRQPLVIEMPPASAPAAAPQERKSRGTQTDAPQNAQSQSTAKQVQDSMESLPPPYSSETSTDNPSAALSASQQPQKMERWQMRWNREFLNNALLKMGHSQYCYLMRNRHTGARRHTKRELRSMRVECEALFSEGVRRGYIDRENIFTRSRWDRARDRVLVLDPLKPLKKQYDGFREWRKEMKNRDREWRMTAVMEDVGDKPRWQAEMTFKTISEDLSKLVKQGKWFEFPTPENIKWWWIMEPDGHEFFTSPSLSHWGPSRRRPEHGEPQWCGPFGLVHGRVEQHPRRPKTGPLPKICILETDQS
ncbi:hypothetical protein F4821DRAFT_234136 [Hypoxylon rubiginosum]|uniref:Uncharacterized protein n=1 Tax=Hypoxylon rubiginosum TaxID=110542 RepID=A0ACC0D694_9PEZI|nr:hypothetical protein F4821DRAFT_234136 [Hypoxylon rubiginosum]